MTPKEKAEELLFKMHKSKDVYGKYPMCFDTSRNCAVIAVDLRLEGDFLFNDIEYGEQSLEYWQQVKQELEKL